MKPFHALALSFCTVLLLAGALFIYQNRRIAGRHEGSPASTVAVRSAVPSPDGRHAPTETKPPTAEETGEVFVQDIMGKLVAAIGKKHVMAVSASKGSLQSWLANADLTPGERDAIQKGLENFNADKADLYLDETLTTSTRAGKISDLEDREKEWIAGMLGQDRNDAFLRYDGKYKRSYAEERAAAAAFRISSATGITASQQEELRGKLLERALNPPASVARKISLRSYGNMTIVPESPDISADAERILNPEQWVAYQEQVKLRSQNLNVDGEMVRSLMESLEPAVMELLESKL